MQRGNVRLPFQLLTSNSIEFQLRPQDWEDCLVLISRLLLSRKQRHFQGYFDVKRRLAWCTKTRWKLKSVQMKFCLFLETLRRIISEFANAKTPLENAIRKRH